MINQIQEGSFLFEPARIGDSTKSPLYAVVVIKLDNGNWYTVKLKKVNKWRIVKLDIVGEQKNFMDFFPEKIKRGLNKKILEYPKFRLLFQLY